MIGDGVLYQVAAIRAPGVSGSGKWEISLAANYAGATNAAAPYAITKDFTPTQGLPLIAAGDNQTQALWNRAMMLLDAIIAGGGGGGGGGVTLNSGLLQHVQGGVDGCLDAFVTVGLNLRSTVRVLDTTLVPIDLSEWVLLAGLRPGGTDIANGILVPPDYNPDTNARYWLKIA